jgi:hypothetical protein
MRLAGMAVVVGFVSSVFLVSPGMAQVKGPADFSFPQAW